MLSPPVIVPEVWDRCALRRKPDVGLGIRADSRQLCRVGLRSIPTARPGNRKFYNKMLDGVEVRFKSLEIEQAGDVVP